MGIYIKGMDMSEIERMVLTNHVQLVFCWTFPPMTLTAKTISESKDTGIRAFSKEYEVVKVPELHGDLIDNDDIGDVLKSLEKYEDVDKDTLEVVMSMLWKIPTVIEAEGE